VAQEIAPMRDYVRAHGIRSQSIAQACRSAGSQHVRVSELNAEGALRALRQARPDVVVYAGGGILRRDFIETPRIGVLNCHGGPLPAFRGMNVVEWALFHGVRPTVAVHFIDTGVDTGPILFRKPLPIESGDSLDRIRGVATRVSVEALLEAVQQLAEGPPELEPQISEAGRQYFTMAEPLVEIAQRWLAERRTPLIDAEEFAYRPPRLPGATTS
jgi:methionyl-tRNA formyltransferase